MSDLNSLSQLLPSQVTIDVSLQGLTGNNVAGKDSYADINIENSILAGQFDAYCVDTDLFVNPTENDLTAEVFSIYETIPQEYLTAIDNPDNLDLVGWILNQCFVGKDSSSVGDDLGIFTFSDVQGAIWTLLGEGFGPGSDIPGVNQARIDAIVNLAQANGTDFSPSFDYTTIFGEQVIGQLGVLLFPDRNTTDTRPYDKQPFIVGVELAKLGPTGSIGDTIFRDDNANGVQDGGEVGISGVQVRLTDKGADGVFGTADDIVIGTQTTDGDGEYLFEGLDAGNYQVEVLNDNGALDGFVQTADPDGTLDNGSMVTLAQGENNLDQDFGYDLPTGSIGDTIFRDDNANGVQDGGEAGISGVQVRLTDKGADGVFGTADDIVIGTQTTDGDGEYLFEGLDAGNYQVEVLNDNGALDGFVQTADPDGTLDNGSMVTLAQGENNLDQDFGYDLPTGSIGDTIFRDDNANGVQDGGETGISGVQVRLTDKGADGVFGTADDIVIGTQTTDGDGEYLFEGLDPGNYQVEVLNDNGALDGFVQTADPDGTLDNGSMVTLAQGENNLDQDFGYDLPTGSIGDTIFRDDNANGVQDGGETGISGVQVRLTDKGADGVFGTADDIVIGTQTTDGDGEYLFEGLDAGNYQVEVLNDNGALDGFVQTADPDGTLDNGSMVTLAQGENNLDQDFGYDLANPNIDIEKFTNGVDADTPDAAPEILAGDVVTWTYEVTNTGNVDFDQSEIVVTDDQEGVITNIIDKGDGDNLLEVGETWIYQKTGIAQDLNVSGGSATFYLTGNSGLDGSDGNIRTFSAGDISVKTSAFSRTDSGVWEEAFLGSFFNGLGVTDTSEGDGSNGLHRIDNVHRDNYVLFEFSESVIVDRAFLDSVVDDSDITVWIGTVNNPFNNHNTLSDAFLNSLEFTEDNTTDSSNSRWADLNAGQVSGNVLVIAALVTDDSPEDRFKLEKVEVKQLETGIYKNLGTVEVTGATDSDPSHYVNPIPDPGIDIEKFVNGIDANNPDDYPILVPGSPVTFTYDVTNTGNVAFAASNVVVTDDNGTANDTSDDFNPNQVLQNGFNVGDTNQNSILDAGETWKYSKTLTVQNLSVSETIRIEAEDLHLNDYSIESNDFASGNKLIKLVGSYYDNDGTASTTFNGETHKYDVRVAYFDELDGKSSAKFKLNGNTIDSWTFDQNLGSYAPDDQSLVVRTVAEDITIKHGDSLSLKGITDDTEFARIDYIELVKKGDNDGVYENVAKVTADGVSDSDISGYVNPSPNVPAGCIETTLSFTGNSSLDGYDGNVRTFSKDGLSVEVRGFSRGKDPLTGQWKDAYVGAYSSGLGVTDQSEGTHAHRVDNLGHNFNYVMFKFSKEVEVDRAYFDAVVDDSDAKFWIGNTNATSLNDALINSFYSEVNETPGIGSYDPRWADINEGGLTGNTLIIAANPDEPTFEDSFKISQLEVCHF
ncbi:SdrD B-like domain-containing protein [Crocosphaera chwakensis]|uniref:SD-repeat containing protein B domain-containing protein n=1 Tax=Crocosphaera chwakensis CCY0110 TaxID=391612 RepID=A3IZB2_9CHRO|nr:SdrD B-like domain-containing protein [Crocosphaera chwakensis]EAZ88187.1 hypothetical protein CY0110_30026 [Crocosphaera chwakensis CCY0110]